MSIETDNVVQIKEFPRPGNLGLEKEGRSKFPNCFDVIQPPRGKDGRWFTGLDEDSYVINNIPNQKERESKRKEIKEKRESLERLTGEDLSGTSPFWNEYFVKINPKRTFDLTNPRDIIDYTVIISSGAVAPTLRLATEGVKEHRESKYYVARANEDVSEKVKRESKKNEAIVEFMKLIKDADRTLLVARYLDLPIRSTTPESNRFDIIQNFLNSDEQLGSVDKFMIAVNKTPEELNIKLIFDDAIKYKVIRFRDQLYQRGNITFGKTPKEVLTKLTLPEMSGELLGIQEEIEMKRKFG